MNGNPSFLASIIKSNCILSKKSIVLSFKNSFTKNDLKELLDRKFKYYFWCKTECEMLIGDLFYKTEQDFKKVDLYKQIEINLNLIVDYVWNSLKLDR